MPFQSSLLVWYLSREEYHSKTDLSPPKCFLSFQCASTAFVQYPLIPFTAIPFDVNLFWWCLSFWSKFNCFQILVACSYFPGRVCVFRRISLQSKDSKDYNTSTVLVLVVLVLNLASMHPGEAKQGVLVTEDWLRHSCHCQSPAVLPSPERPAHSCSR